MELMLVVEELRSELTVSIGVGCGEESCATPGCCGFCSTTAVSPCVVLLAPPTTDVDVEPIDSDIAAAAAISDSVTPTAIATPPA